jgi:hypothetical protein
VSEAPWYSGLDADVQAHVTGRGWHEKTPVEAAVEAAKSHFAAQKLIGVPPEQVIRLPKDATDPSYQGIYDRVVGMGVPQKPEDYKFPATVAEADQAFVREIAVKYKLPEAAAMGLAADLRERGEGSAAAQANAAETTKAANQVALRTAWGGSYDQNAFSATRAAEGIGFTDEVLSAMAGLPAEKYVANMNALLKLSQQLNEATILRGGNPVRDPTAGLSQEQARERMKQLQDDKAWGAKFLAGDADTMAEFQKLTRLMVGAPR